MLEWVGARPPQAQRHPIGAVGCCMSGPFVVWAAAQFPERFNCIASTHGAQLVTEASDSPHRMAPRLRCEACFACAQTDRWASPADIDRLDAALKDADTAHRIEWYPDTEHGFVFPQRTGLYHRVGAERHWERLFGLFARRLR